MATLQNLGVLKYRDKAGNWKPLPAVLQSSGGSGGGGISTISGKGQPTESTVGRLNQLYRDESTDKLYICTGVDGGYTWAAVVSDTEDAVKYTAQTLTNAQKQQARTNIGAGTSNFSGSYNDLTNTPVLDTTLEQSGKPADAKAVGDAIGSAIDAVTTILGASKVDKSQGTENAGKILGIGASGIVTPVDKPVYTLPIATPTALGGVMPVAKTTAMTQGVGVSEDGKLYTAPSGGGTDKSLGITSATVGQIAKITAVDAQGKPTGWEAVNMPSGGGKETWEIVADITLAENAKRILAEFEPCEKIKVILYIQSSATGLVRVFPNTATTPGGNDRAHIALANINAIPKATCILIDFGINKFISIENMYIATYSVAQREDKSFGNLEINSGAMQQKYIAGRYAANLDGGVNKILVDGSANDALGAGTRLTIYGVKK